MLIYFLQVRQEKSAESNYVYLCHRLSPFVTFLIHKPTHFHPFPYVCATHHRTSHLQFASHTAEPLTQPEAQADHCASSVSYCLWRKRKTGRGLPSQKGRVKDVYVGLILLSQCVRLLQHGEKRTPLIEGSISSPGGEARWQAVSACWDGWTDFEPPTACDGGAHTQLLSDWQKIKSCIFSLTDLLLPCQWIYSTWWVCTVFRFPRAELDSRLQFDVDVTNRHTRIKLKQYNTTPLQ